MSEINPHVDENGVVLAGKEEQFKLWIKKEKKEKYVTELEEHIKYCREAVEYSITRFDILIISLSGGALGFSINFIKDVAQKNTFPNLWQLKTSWILFGSALIMNLLSQATSYLANKFEIKISKELIKRPAKNEISTNQTKWEKKKIIFDNSTIILNSASLFSFIGGIVFLIIFTFCNF